MQAANQRKKKQTGRRRRRPWRGSSRCRLCVGCDIVLSAAEGPHVVGCQPALLQVCRAATQSRFAANIAKN